MIDGLKPYPAMKNSGVPWLGDVPTHWHVSPAFAVYRPRQVKNTGLVESTVLSLSYGRIIVRAPEKLRGLVPESFETYQIVEPGHIIVRTTDLQNDRTSLRIGHSRHRGIITAAYMCLEAKPIVLNAFGYQYLNAYDLLKIIYGFGSGLRQNLEFSDIKRMPVLVPPKDEQAAIVRFLDHADRRIRRYICAKQKLIKLLEEQKQAIIHRAVTRGLDPSVRLKPSGVEWLGEVPEHWAVRRIASFSPKITNGWVGPTRDALRDEGVPYIQSLHVKRGTIRFAKRYFVDRGWLDARPKIVLREGDVVVVQTGDIGQVSCVPPEFDGAGCHALIIIRTDPSVMNGSFLDLVLRSRYGFECLKSLQTGALHPHLNCTWVREVAITVPPVDEQIMLLRSTISATSSLDRAILSAEAEMGLLREYRTRLIADVVTGKLDVRQVAMRLPDEVEEPALLAEIDAEDETDAADADGVPEEAEA